MESNAWDKAKPLTEFFKAHAGETLGQETAHLKFIDLRQEAYGDRRLYVDDEGNYWEDYYSIGD